MGIFDRAKDALTQHSDKVDSLVDRAAEQVDKRTGGQHGEQIDQGAAAAKDRLENYLRREDPPA